MKKFYPLCIKIVLFLSLAAVIIFSCLHFHKRISALEKERKAQEEREETVISECKLSLGDPLSPWLVERIGCKLPAKTRSVDIEISNDKGYVYFIAGYEDPAYLNCVYDSGWMKGSRTVELERPELYYVFVSSTAIIDSDGSATEEDIANHKLTVSRYYSDSVYHSSMMPPRYYFEDGYMQEKVEYIRELLKRTAANGDAFMFITDEHWHLNAKQSPKLANYLSETTGINKIFSGGDRVDDGYDISVSREFMKALGNDNYYPVAGNHDFGDYADESLVYASSFLHLSGKDNVTWGEEGSLYYYVDDDAKKMRYIVLQAFEPNPTKQDLNVIIEYNDKQIEWFKNEALDVDEGYTILIFSHVFLYGYDSTKEFMMPTTFEGYSDIYDAVADYNGKGEIAAILQGHFHWDASTEIYRRTKLDQSYDEAEGRIVSAIPEGVGEIYVTVDAADKLPYRVVGYSATDGAIVYDSGLLDVSQKIDLRDLSLRYEVVFEKNAGVELSFADLDNCKVYSVRGSIPLVVTACDRYAAEYPPTFDQSERVYGTLTEQAFDVVVLDKTEKKLYFVRIGAPAKNNDGSLTEVREFCYG